MARPPSRGSRAAADGCTGGPAGPAGAWGPVARAQPATDPQRRRSSVGAGGGRPHPHPPRRRAGEGWLRPRAAHRPELQRAPGPDLVGCHAAAAAAAAGAALLPASAASGAEHVRRRHGARGSGRRLRAALGWSAASAGASVLAGHAVGRLGAQTWTLTVALGRAARRRLRQRLRWLPPRGCAATAARPPAGRGGAAAYGRSEWHRAAASWWRARGRRQSTCGCGGDEQSAGGGAARGGVAAGPSSYLLDFELLEWQRLGGGAVPGAGETTPLELHPRRRSQAAARRLQRQGKRGGGLGVRGAMSGGLPRPLGIVRASETLAGRGWGRRCYSQRRVRCLGSRWWVSSAR